jgi:PAS domain-containing protein/DNA-binding CsgD family transcriptional regulator
MLCIPIVMETTGNGFQDSFYDSNIFVELSNRIGEIMMEYESKGTASNQVAGLKAGKSLCRQVEKKTEETLRESKQLLSNLIDFLPDATFAIDKNGKVVIAWNLAIEEMTGIKAEDMIGKGNYEYAIPFYGVRKPILIDLALNPNGEIENKYLLDKMEGNVFVTEVDVDFKGECRALWAKAKPLYDGKGNVVGAIESIRDITDRKRMEEALIKAHEQLELRVAERTAKLEIANEYLKREIEDRKHTEEALEIKSQSLEKANTTLNVVLKRWKENKIEIEQKLLNNVNELIIPYIEKLKECRLDSRSITFLTMLEMNLQDLLSPFMNTQPINGFNFTVKELQIVNLIKGGKSTKEIAELLMMSKKAVDYHRDNIRKKLNLKKKSVNLRSHLSSLQSH